jgi:hypothetical protein
MKNLRILPLLLALLFLFGCNLIDKIKGVQEFDFDVELTTSVSVNIDETDPNSVNETFTLDAKSNPDVVDNLDKITEYDIWTITVSFTDYVGEEGISFEGTLNVGSYTADFTGMNAVIPSNYLFGGEIYLTLDQSDLNALNAELMNGHKLNCSVTGTVSNKPVSFTINFVLFGVIYGEA